MKIFFDKAFYLVVLLIVCVFFISACTKKKTEKNVTASNPLVEAYAKSQNEIKKEACFYL